MNEKKLPYINSLGETEWQDKAKHVGIVSKDNVQVIVEVLKENISEATKVSAIYESQEIDLVRKGVSNELVRLKNVIADGNQIIEKLSDLESLNEFEWRHIYIRLLKANNKEFATYFGLEIKSDSYYRKAIDTASRVELLSGLPNIKHYENKETEKPIEK